MGIGTDAVVPARHRPGVGGCAWVVGSINRDIVAYAPKLPAPGETVLGVRSALFPGGKGCNQAVAMARLGVDVRMIGRVGDDGFGRDMTSFLVAEGVEVSAVAVLPGIATGIALIVVDERSENAITVVPGANAVWCNGLQAFEPQPGDAVVCQLEIPIEVVADAFRAGRRWGAITVLNPAPFAAPVSTLLPFTDVVVVNEIEAGQMTGRAVDARDDLAIAEAGRGILLSGAQIVVVTLGARGVMVVTAEAAQFVPAVAVKARDTTGAGDCFTGAFVSALLRGTDAVGAAEFGVRAAANSVTRDGAAASYPTLGEL